MHRKIAVCDHSLSSRKNLSELSTQFVALCQQNLHSMAKIFVADMAVFLIVFHVVAFKSEARESRKSAQKTDLDV